jgi:hypothetical protein
MPDRAAGRRTVALVLYGSAAVLTLMAALVWLRVVDLGESTRAPLSGVLVLAAISDVFVGWRFFSTANE